MAVRIRREGSVEQITTGRRLFGVLPVSSHCYRVGSVLVDAGAPNQAQALLDHVEDGEITDVLLTHAHEDHVGLAAALADQGARVLAPEPLLDTLTDPPELPGYRQRSWGRADPVEAEALGEAVDTPVGRFEVIPTPGHSPHHVSLHHAEKGWVFTGDAYLGVRADVRFDEDLGRELASLRRLRSLAPQALFPGHGSIERDPKGGLEHVLRWHSEKAQQARKLREEGRSVDSIRRELFGLEGVLRWFTGGEFSKTNLVRELLRLPPDALDAPEV